jgi:hypothetical protein
MVKTCRLEIPLDRAMTICPFVFGFHFIIAGAQSRRLD